MNNKEFIKIRLLDNENFNKIKLDTLSWNEIIADKTILYNAIIDILLNKDNLFYYATQNESTKTMLDTKEYIKLLISKNIFNEKIEQIFINMGWCSNKNFNINNTTFQGDLAEYLMCILIDKVLNIKTIIAKISLKTSPKMSSYGNDNIFYDFDKKILFFGESKFYSNVSSALDRAVNSLKEHATITEFSYITNHSTHIIAENNEKRESIVETIETVKMDEIVIYNIIFIINDDIYLKNDYENIINNFLKKSSYFMQNKEKIMLVFLPILSKDELLNLFIKRVNDELL